MRSRVLAVGSVVIAMVAMASPAVAKWDIAGADIIGPGLETGMRIDAPDAYGLWDSGIDATGGSDDARAESVAELGITPADLGPRYLVTYRLGIGRARQDLYPYAKGGPVTHTPPGQELGRRADTPGFLRNTPITAGWYQSPDIFFEYLVAQGLPESNPVHPIGTREKGVPAPSPPTMPWTGIVAAVAALAALGALSLAAMAARRRHARSGTLLG